MNVSRLKDNIFKKGMHKKKDGTWAYEGLKGRRQQIEVLKRVMVIICRQEQTSKTLPFEIPGSCLDCSLHCRKNRSCSSWAENVLFFLLPRSLTEWIHLWLRVCSEKESESPKKDLTHGEKWGVGSWVSVVWYKLLGIYKKTMTFPDENPSSGTRIRDRGAHFGLSGSLITCLS